MTTWDESVISRICWSFCKAPRRIASIATGEEPVVLIKFRIDSLPNCGNISETWFVINSNYNEFNAPPFPFIFYPTWSSSRSNSNRLHHRANRLLCGEKVSIKYWRVLFISSFNVFRRWRWIASLFLTCVRSRSRTFRQIAQLESCSNLKTYYVCGKKKSVTDQRYRHASWKTCPHGNLRANFIESQHIVL